MDTAVLILSVIVVVLFFVIMTLLAVLLARARSHSQSSQTKQAARQGTWSAPGVGPQSQSHRITEPQIRVGQSRPHEPVALAGHNPVVTPSAPSLPQSNAGPVPSKPAPLAPRVSLPNDNEPLINTTADAVVFCIAGERQGYSASIKSGRVTIGRDVKCQLRLDELFVAPQHAEIRVDSATGRYILEDLGTTHGTWVDGQRVMQVSLAPQTQVRIGHSILVLVAPNQTVPVPKEDRWSIPPAKTVVPFLADFAFEPNASATSNTTTTYVARSLRDRHSVNVKYLTRPIYTDNAFFRAKFDQQLAIGLTINHPSCAKIYGGNSQHSVPYIIEHRYSGLSLAERLARRAPLDIGEISTIIGQVCDALAYLHKRNIIHQGITPENIVFDESDIAYLANCGFARLFNEPQRTPLGILVGNPHYLAPELIRGDLPTPQTDLYALGVIAFQMATGRLPFEGNSSLEIAKQHQETRPLIPKKLNQDLPDGLSLAILKALDKDPLHRFHTARDMAKAFGYSQPFVGMKEATGLLYMPAQRAAPVPLPDNLAQVPRDYGVHVQEAQAAARLNSGQLRLQNVANGVIVVVIGQRTVITRELINRADNMISRTNGQIYVQDNSWWVGELPEAHSANGLFVNNVRVTEPRRLKLGDQIRFGKTTLKIIA
jgi:pSer/pThr/pTyr-binding forkhead associated (FHA) protein